MSPSLLCRYLYRIVLFSGALLILACALGIGLHRHGSLLSAPTGLSENKMRSAAGAWAANQEAPPYTPAAQRRIAPPATAFDNNLAALDTHAAGSAHPSRTLARAVSTAQPAEISAATPASQPAISKLIPVQSVNARDGQIVLTSSTEAALAVQGAAALGDTPPATASMLSYVSQVINGETFRWNVTVPATRIDLLKPDQVKLTGTGTLPATGVVTFTGGTLPDPTPPAAGADGSWELTTTLAASGDIKINGTTVATLNIPVADLKPPSISKASTNRDQAPSAQVPSTQLHVYGTYLHVAGTQEVTPNSSVVFQLFGRTDSKAPFTYIPLNDQPHPTTAAWDTPLKLPALAVNTEGRLTAFVASPTTHGPIGDTPWQFTVKSTNDPFPLPAPTPLTVRKQADGSTPMDVDRSTGVIYTNETKLFVEFPAPTDANYASDATGDVFLNGEPKPTTLIGTTLIGSKYQYSFVASRDGQYTFKAAYILGNTAGPLSNTVTVQINTVGPHFTGVEPGNLAYAYDRTLRVSFDPQHPLNALSSDLTTLKTQIKITRKNLTSTTTDFHPDDIKLDAKANALNVTFNSTFEPGDYTFTIAAGAVTDIYNTALAADYMYNLFMPVGGDLPTVLPGIPGPTGPYVAFDEFLKPRPIVDGYNPSDHVETRVARLYYYRDAHRVAQIVNRNVHSYNRAAVDMQRQLADKSRQIADQATANRKKAELNAIESARKSREAEHNLQNLRNGLANIERGAGQQMPTDAAKFDAIVTQMHDQINTASSEVQRLRDLEAQANISMQGASVVEDQARDEQFRREVAAASADPDTYAPGVPNSVDPVQQVSISVIGEGLIQLRGPIKGINEIRLMINQIDSPVGQVRVGVHTVQVNGEHGERMERVASKIQTYIDHSRFLSVQSTEMLRKAVTKVAAIKANECSQGMALTQADRDQRYLFAFFGDDFIRELQSIDSEFLHTGNKLLSLHSMDSTSLPSALFLMALAKNSTRMAILQEFEQMLRTQLPAAESNYLEAGFTAYKHTKGSWSQKWCDDGIQLLAENARFQSTFGFFDAEICGDDIMSPLQREFIRLAQIFKSRLVVELEYAQRVHERGMIEERLGNRQNELESARALELKANKELGKAQAALVDTQRRIPQSIAAVQAEINQCQQQVSVAVPAAETAGKQLHGIGMIIDAAIERKEKQEVQSLTADQDANIKRDLERFRNSLASDATNLNITLSQNAYATVVRVLNDAGVGDIKKLRVLDVEATPDEARRLGLSSLKFTITESGTQITAGNQELAAAIAKAKEIGTGLDNVLSRYNVDRQYHQRLQAAKALLQGLSPSNTATLLDQLQPATTMLKLYEVAATQLLEDRQALHADLNSILALLVDLHGDATQIPTRSVLSVINHLNAASQQQNGSTSESTIAMANAAIVFRGLLDAQLNYDIAKRQAQQSMHPLDYKKFLEMFIDDIEDKYVELLEGTRAHTSNIDAYLKRLSTALDDDLNTQFYYPSFKHIRSASRMWDVTLGDVETTTILANNRGFAKVEPQATMEFDLPQRDILINEAMNGAKAAIDDFGALVQDPTFLALSKLGAGQSTATPAPGATGGLSTVRDVLPSLSTNTAEDVLGQHGPGNPQLGASLEALIPDPAIYKFETGTGFEIRPVIEPDGQSVVFNFNYMYTTNVREPVRADEKHLGRVKRHYIHTDVQLGNFELREVSRYVVALKASRTSRGVPLLEDIPVAGILFRPLPNAEASLQENIILAQATVFPTLFDLMGLRWAPAVADLDALRLKCDDFLVRSRNRNLHNRVFDYSSSSVDQFLRIPESERRPDLYRSQETIPVDHPNGYVGPGLNLRDSRMREGYSPNDLPTSKFIPGQSNEGTPLPPVQRLPFPGAAPPGLETGGPVLVVPTPSAQNTAPATTGSRTYSPTSDAPPQNRTFQNKPLAIPRLGPGTGLQSVEKPIIDGSPTFPDSAPYAPGQMRTPAAPPESNMPLPRRPAGDLPPPDGVQNALPGAAQQTQPQVSSGWNVKQGMQSLGNRLRPTGRARPNGEANPIDPRGNGSASRNGNAPEKLPISEVRMPYRSRSVR